MNLACASRGAPRAPFTLPVPCGVQGAQPPSPAGPSGRPSPHPRSSAVPPPIPFLSPLMSFLALAYLKPHVLCPILLGHPSSEVASWPPVGWRLGCQVRLGASQCPPGSDTFQLRLLDNCRWPVNTRWACSYPSPRDEGDQAGHWSPGSSPVIGMVGFSQTLVVKRSWFSPQE